MIKFPLSSILCLTDKGQYSCNRDDLFYFYHVRPLQNFHPIPKEYWKEHLSPEPSRTSPVVSLSAMGSHYLLLRVTY